MYHPKRPSPASYLICGGICAVGTVTVIARGFHNFTEFTISEPFNGITYAIGAAYAIVGPVIGAWLATGSKRRENAALRAENAELRAERKSFGDLLEAVQKADAQNEVTTVLARKILKAVEDQRSNEITQPLAPVRSITGKGGGN